jgi:hypothetical protein
VDNYGNYGTPRNRHPLHDDSTQPFICPMGYHENNKKILNGHEIGIVPGGVITFHPSSHTIQTNVQKIGEKEYPP